MNSPKTLYQTYKWRIVCLSEDEVVLEEKRTDSLGNDAWIDIGGFKRHTLVKANERQEGKGPIKLAPYFRSTNYDACYALIFYYLTDHYHASS